MTRAIDDVEHSNSHEPLIPGLPDDIARLCLLHLPYPNQSLLRIVSSLWKKTITDPRFFLSKHALSLSLPYIFVLAFHKSTAKIQWQVFDPRSYHWFRLPPMPCTNAVNPLGFSCVSIPQEGKLFVLGGKRSDTDTCMSSTYMYNMFMNQWTICASMLTPRSFFTAASVRGKIIVVGGTGDEFNTNTFVESYDSKTDTWTQVAKLRKKLDRYDSAVLGNKMCVAEGVWTWPFTRSPRGGVYDSDRDTWQDMSDNMRAGWTSISFVLNDRLFVLSEHGDCPMRCYDEVNDSWRYVTGEKFPCGAMQRPYSVGVADGKVYVVACELKVAIGNVFEGKHKEISVEWEVASGGKKIHDLSPCSCQVIYA